MRRYNVMLDSSTVEVLRQLGKRNLSAGIRTAAAQIRSPMAPKEILDLVPAHLRSIDKEVAE
jgi:hypothetical protein